MPPFIKKLLKGIFRLVEVFKMHTHIFPTSDGRWITEENFDIKPNVFRVSSSFCVPNGEEIYKTRAQCLSRIQQNQHTGDIETWFPKRIVGSQFRFLVIHSTSRCGFNLWMSLLKLLWPTVPILQMKCECKKRKTKVFPLFALQYCLRQLYCADAHAKSKVVKLKDQR